MPLGTTTNGPASYSMAIALAIAGQDPIWLNLDKKEFIETSASESEKEAAFQSFVDYLSDYPGLAQLGATKYWIAGQQMTPTP